MRAERPHPFGQEVRTGGPHRAVPAGGGPSATRLVERTAEEGDSMGSHEVTKSHLVSAIIVGWVLVALVWLIFGFLSQNYLLYVPMLVAYGIWTVVSLLIFGRGLDREMASEAH